MKQPFSYNVSAFCLAVLTSLTAFSTLPAAAEKAPSTEWPTLTTVNKPGVRWWWLGSAVDEKNLAWNLASLNKAGIGTVEITPIYGVKGEDDKEVAFLSPRWMQLYSHTVAEAGKLSMWVDMNTGTGWPYGGPTISTAQAASRQLMVKQAIQALPGGRATSQRLSLRVADSRQQPLAKLQALLFVGSDGYREQIPLSQFKEGFLEWGAPQDGIIYALFVGKTLQQVKRAAPGGQGLVMNHLSKAAFNHYVSRFDEAFQASSAPWPHSFFNDSYEVYGADWSENLLEAFKRLRSYDLADHLPEFLGEGDPDLSARVICDYRETVADLLLNEFTQPWTDWAHSKGAITRNQAHGSPGNLLDLYGAIDIPECESFGITAFDIPGFRLDSVRKVSDSNPATLKYASSAAHVTGKPLTSAESMTWLTEHFKTSLSQIKPEMDQLFLNGINRVFFHGAPYTPQEAPWPGWLFYASILVNQNNTIFRDMDALNTYAATVQAFLQEGQPDNEVLLYFPIHDIWQTWRRGHYVTFDIHKIGEKLPVFEKLVFDIRKMGYDLDYVSDNQLLAATVEGKRIKTQGGASYALILVPDCRFMPASTAAKLVELTKAGATVAFLNRLPEDVPGLGQLEARRDALKQAISAYRLHPRVSSYFGKPFDKGRVMYGNYLQDILEQVPCTYEAVAGEWGAGFIRRRYPDGFVYFVAQQQNKPIDAWVPLGVKASSAMLFDPVSGRKGQATLRTVNGKTQVYLQLKPGASLLIRTFDRVQIKEPLFPLYIKDGMNLQQVMQAGMQVTNPRKHEARAFTLTGDWQFTFGEGQPTIPGSFVMRGNPQPWTTIKHDSATVFAGTGRYTLTFKMPKEKADDWRLDLDGLSESARVTVNGVYAGKVWSLPYTLYIGQLLKPGKVNTLTLEVTNLPANRIADYDRRGVKWRIFKEINFVDVAYKETTYGHWPVMPAGLTKPIRLVPQQRMNPLEP